MANNALEDVVTACGGTKAEAERKANVKATREDVMNLMVYFRCDLTNVEMGVF